MRKIVGALAVSALAAAAWASPAAAAEVKIGYSIAKTGLFAPAAPSQINAYNLWAEQVNARGGLDIGGKERRKVTLIQYDDQSNPGNAVKIYEKLITQDKVDLLLSRPGARRTTSPSHLCSSGTSSR